MTKTNGTTRFVKENAWAIVLLLMGWAVGFALLQQQVTILASQVAEYPSADYFDLKFNNIEEKLIILEMKLN